MERALSESIFCCPRTRFFREECFVLEALCVVLAGFAAADDEDVVLWCFGGLALGVAGF